MFRKMFIPWERIAAAGESEDTNDTDSVPDIASIGEIGESSDISSHGLLSLVYTRSYGKAIKTKKDREPFYKGYGVVYIPRDINGLTKKLHLLSAEFFAVTPQSGTSWFMYWTRCLD